MLSVASPAKVNLSLEILGRRPDGYHEVLSVMQTVSLCDYLSFEPYNCLEIICDLPGWVAEKSLVYRATRLMAQLPGSGAGARIRITKQIPLSSGLGGDSSNAAAALNGLNHLWGLGMSAAQLGQIAAGLGTDVPFFLQGGTALASGRGECLTPLMPLQELHLVILHPALSRPDKKTANLYNKLKAEDYSNGNCTRELVKNISSGAGISRAILCNGFETAALGVFEGLAACQEQFRAAGAEDVRLAGSGPALFAVFDDGQTALEVCALLKSSGLDAWAAETAAPKYGDRC